MHNAPCTNTSNSVSGQSWRISATWSSESSRDKITRLTPTVFQKRTAAALTVLACTDKWMTCSGQVSRTMSISPGSDMISASGFSAMTGAMSAR